MKCEWKTVKIGDLGQVMGGATPSTKDPKNYSGNIPWITPKDLSVFNGRFISQGERNITQKGLESCSTHILPKNSVLFSSRAPIGYMAIAANELCTNQGFKSVIPNSDTDYLFLYYLLQYNKEKIESMGSGTTFKEVSGSTMRNIEVSVPGLEMQKKVAKMLSSLDDKIELNTAINHNLQQQAQLLYEHLLDGDITRHRLGDILTLLKDGTHNPPKRLEKGIPLITGQTLSNGFISYEKMTYIAESDYQTIHKTYQPIENDLILTKIGTVGKVAILRNSDLPIAVHCNSALLRFNSNIISQQWGFFLLNSSAFGIELRKKVTNTVQDFVSLGHLADIIITLPPAEVIKRYDGYFKTILETLSNNDFENRRLAMLRDALLPKLMSGEIDVSEVEL